MNRSSQKHRIRERLALVTENLMATRSFPADPLRTPQAGPAWLDLAVGMVEHVVVNGCPYILAPWRGARGRRTLTHRSATTGQTMKREGTWHPDVGPAAVFGTVAERPRQLRAASPVIRLARARCASNMPRKQCHALRRCSVNGRDVRYRARFGLDLTGRADRLAPSSLITTRTRQRHGPWLEKGKT